MGLVVLQLIFTFLESFSPVFQQWGFSVQEVGLAFLALVSACRR